MYPPRRARNIWNMPIVHAMHPTVTNRTIIFFHRIPPHPLDQLSAAEITQAAALATKYATSVSKTNPRFNTITLAVRCPCLVIHRTLSCI